MLAQLNFSNPNITNAALNNSSSFLGAIVSRIFIYSIYLSGLFFLVRFIVAGYTYLTSLGDPGKIQSAAQTIIHSLVGIVIVVSAFFIAQILDTVLGLNLPLF